MTLKTHNFTITLIKYILIINKLNYRFKVIIIALNTCSSITLEMGGYIYIYIYPPKAMKM